MTLTQWEEFRAKFPNRSMRIKELGAALYTLGAQKARNDPKLDQLESLMRGLPQEGLDHFGLAPSFSKDQLLTTVFELGPRILLNLERGGH